MYKDMEVLSVMPRTFKSQPYNNPALPQQTGVGWAILYIGSGNKLSDRNIIEELAATIYLGISLVFRDDSL
jgi:hypothetical protein